MASSPASAVKTERYFGPQRPDRCKVDRRLEVGSRAVGIALFGGVQIGVLADFTLHLRSLALVM